MNFIMLGMGYISSKHLDAIKAVGGNLLAYHDISDVVGHVDSRFIDAKYYREFIHFDCFVDRYQAGGMKIDYAVILLPNHLHNPACRWALNRGMDVIVEKPLVIHERNLDELKEVEEKTGRKINTILQLRLHENTKKMISDHGQNTVSVNIEYATPRGPWFRDGSWKADTSKAGGVATAIGIHLFDLAGYAFGKWIQYNLESVCLDKIKGQTSFERAEVEWSLSVESTVKPKRSFNVNGIQYDFTNGFNDLHTESYRKILAGEGFGIEDARMGVNLTEAIRNTVDFSSQYFRTEKECVYVS